MELNEIVSNIDPSSFTYHGEKKFKRKNLTQYDRELVEAFEVQIKIRDKVVPAKSGRNHHEFSLPMGAC